MPCNTCTYTAYKCTYMHTCAHDLHGQQVYRGLCNRKTRAIPVKRCWVQLSLLMDLLALVLLHLLALEPTLAHHSWGQMGLSVPVQWGWQGRASTFPPVSLGPTPGKPRTLLRALGSSQNLSELQFPHLFSDPTTPRCLPSQAGFEAQVGK